ncbi:hypothetical protein ACP70R_030542 [Stipagrostis hirtigluma subsp. patula]
MAATTSLRGEREEGEGRERKARAASIDMGNSLRCCLACVLPCGALDLVRIVHLSGRVDEYGRAVSAGEVLAAHPNHVLSRPCSSQQGVVRRILIVSPDSELERGEIYFLIPAASVPDAKKGGGGGGGGGAVAARHVRSKSEGSVVVGDHLALGAASPEKPPPATTTTAKRKKAQQHRRRMSTGSHASPWQPHLACIAEDP